MNEDLDHDAIQCRGLALLMQARDVLFMGPGEELYRVDPTVMPETYIHTPEAPETPNGMFMFFAEPQPVAHTMMTWVNIFTGQRRRFSDTEMEPYADPLSMTLNSCTVQEAWRRACEWWHLYRPEEEWPDYTVGYGGNGTWQDFEVSP